MPSILFISELYYPEETSTGYFVTGVAEGLATEQGSSVRVLCAQPTYSKRGEQAPREETHNQVSIRRLSAPVGDKNKLLGRLWNALSLTIRMGWGMLWSIKRGDIVLVVTNPPSLPLFAGWICRLKGAVPVLMVQDLYPDVLVPTGLTREGSLLYKAVDGFQRHMLRQMERIIVLGRDMEKRVANKLQGDPTKLSIIPNWGDIEAIRPEKREENPIRRKYELEDKFIIQFSGNLGRTHGLEDLVELARDFTKDKRVHFLVFGWGAGRSWLEAQISEKKLSNMTLLQPCPKEELGDYLTCCDLFFLPFKPGMEGISVPSRLYNVMAAGNAILAVASRRSELAMVVEEESIGCVVDPGDIESMADFIREVISKPRALETMRERARATVEEKYTQAHVVEAYARLLKNIAG